MVQSSCPNEAGKRERSSYKERAGEEPGQGPALDEYVADQRRIVRACAILRGLIPSLSFSGSYTNAKISLMIDTGSQGNVIKLSSVPQSVEIDNSSIKTLRGISHGFVRTMGIITKYYQYKQK